MKNKILFSLCAIALFLFSNNVKAQDDPNVGFYADGVKVTELNCYAFQTLTVVFPYNSAYSNFDRFIIRADYDNPWGGGNYNGCFNILSKASVLTKAKGNYIIYELFSAGVDAAPAQTDFNDAHAYSGLSGYISRKGLAHYIGKTPETDLRISIGGETIDGYKEEYDQASGSVRKITLYTFEELGNVLKLHLVNRQNVPERKINLSQPCTFEGSKVDFNNLGKAASGNSNSAPAKTTPLKTETPAKTSSTTSSSSTGSVITTTIIKTQAALKPFDKTKPGYFEEKDGGKISRAGYKKGDDYNGEVREYNTDGTVSEINIYKDGVQDGLSLKFDDDGKLSLSGFYKNGNQDGTFQWYSNGVLQKTAKYVNGEEQ